MVDKVKKLSFYISKFWLGGAERVTITLANGLASHGYDVEMLAMRPSGPTLKELFPAVKIFDLGSLVQGENLDSPTVSRKIFMKYFRDVPQPDILFTRPGNFKQILLCRTLNRCKTEIVHVIHGGRVAHPPIFSKAYLKQLAVKILIRRHVHFVAVSNGVASEFEPLYGKGNIHTIYNPVVDDEIMAAADAARAKNVYEPKDRPVIVNVGRMDKGKGLDMLIRAFKKVLTKVPAKLALVGDGDEREAIKRYVSDLGLDDDVVFYGSRPDPYPYIANADLFAMPSESEGLSTVLIEALACGVQVVSTDHKYGASEILDGGKYGVLVPIGDDDAMAREIIGLLTSKTHRFDADMLRDRARFFSKENAVQRYIDLIEQI